MENSTSTSASENSAVIGQPNDTSSLQTDPDDRNSTCNPINKLHSARADQTDFSSIAPMAVIVDEPSSVCGPNSILTTGSSDESLPSTSPQVDKCSTTGSPDEKLPQEPITETADIETPNAICHDTNVFDAKSQLTENSDKFQAKLANYSPPTLGGVAPAITGNDDLRSAISETPSGTINYEKETLDICMQIEDGNVSEPPMSGEQLPIRNSTCNEESHVVSPVNGTANTKGFVTPDTNLVTRVTAKFGVNLDEELVRENSISVMRIDEATSDGQRLDPSVLSSTGNVKIKVEVNSEIDQNSAAATVTESTVELSDQQKITDVIKLEYPLILASNQKVAGKLNINSAPTYYSDAERNPITQATFINGSQSGRQQATSEIEFKPIVPKVEPYRSIVVYSSSEEEQEENSSSSDSDDSSSSSSLASSSSESDSGMGKQRRPAWKNKKELTIEDLVDYDLPAIEELRISVGKAEIEHVGDILSIIDCLVVVQALRGMPVLHFDTILFLEDGESIGKVFDVFGPVIHPLYSIRVAKEEIAEKKLSAKTRIFYAPLQKDMTNLVFAEELKQSKGSDASWLDNKEPPESLLDYSDDEQERVAKNKKKLHRRGLTEPALEASTDQPHTKRDRRFVGNRDAANSNSSRDSNDGQQHAPGARWRPRYQSNVFRSLSTNSQTYPSDMTGHGPRFPPSFFTRPPPPHHSGQHSFPPTNQGWPPMNVPGSHSAGRGAPLSSPVRCPPGPFSQPPPPAFAAPPFPMFNHPLNVSNGSSGAFPYPSPPPSLPPNNQNWNNTGGGRSSAPLNLFYPPPPPPPQSSSTSIVDNG